MTFKECRMYATNIKPIKTSLNKAVRTMTFKECRHATNIKPIKTSLNKAVRTMTFKECRHATNIKLKILPLDECYKLQFMWKLGNNKLPMHTASKYTTISHNHTTRQTTQSNLLPSIRLECDKRFTIYSGTRLWLTDIPLHIKSIRTLKQFSIEYSSYPPS